MIERKLQYCRTFILFYSNYYSNPKDPRVFTSTVRTNFLNTVSLSLSRLNLF